MAKKFFREGRPQNGITYQEYIDRFARKVNDVDPDTLDPLKRRSWESNRLNFQRSQRVAKTYKIPAELKTVVRQIKTPQLWMVITENWCGDSAQTLPQIVKIAEEQEVNFLVMDIILGEFSGGYLGTGGKNGKYDGYQTGGDKYDARKGHLGIIRDPADPDRDQDRQNNGIDRDQYIGFVVSD